MAFASGKYANALCGICGFPLKYSDLKQYVFNQRPNGLMVCDTCLDIDNEQLQVGKYHTPEAIALRNPRPDSAELPACRGFFGWNPVLGLKVQVRMGQVTVSVT